MSDRLKIAYGLEFIINLDNGFYPLSQRSGAKAVQNYYFSRRNPKN